VKVLKKLIKLFVLVHMLCIWWYPFHFDGFVFHNELSVHGHEQFTTIFAFS